MGPLIASTTETAAVGASIAVNVGGEVVGMAVGREARVASTDAPPPHAEISTRSAANTKAEINRGHRYISNFYQKPARTIRV